MTSTDTRPTLSDLWWKHQIKLRSLVTALNMPRETVVAMFRGHPVVRRYAEKVLAHLSTLYGEEYTLETVNVPTLPETANQSEVAQLMQQIEEEYTAGVLAMKGGALGTSQLKFITRRMENMQQYLKELREVGGEEVTMQFLARLPDSDHLTALDQR